MDSCSEQFFLKEMHCSSFEGNKEGFQWPQTNLLCGGKSPKLCSRGPEILSDDLNLLVLLGHAVAGLITLGGA